LLRREDLLELGLDLLLELGDLLRLLVSQVQPLGHESRDQMEPATGTTGAAKLALARRAAGTATVLAATALTTLARRTIGGTLLPAGSHGKGGNREDADDRKKCRKTPHGKLLNKSLGTGNEQGF
jgi:hypothetical protein